MADCGTLTVEPAFDPSLVEVSACTEGWSGSVGPGDQFSVQVYLDNGNDAQATVSVAVLADGTEIGRADNIGVPSFGGQAGVTDLNAPESPGDYNVTAEIVSAEPSTAEAESGSRLARADGGVERVRRLDRGCPTC